MHNDEISVRNDCSGFISQGLGNALDKVEQALAPRLYVLAVLDVFGQRVSDYLCSLLFGWGLTLHPQTTSFHSAPASAKGLTPPLFLTVAN
jgi:hypothetical protein